MVHVHWGEKCAFFYQNYLYLKFVNIIRITAMTTKLTNGLKIMTK